QRPEASGAAPLTPCIPGHDELLAPGRLHLEPVSRPLPLLVAGGNTLRDDALQPLLLDGGEKRATVLEQRRDSHGWGLLEHLLEHLSALDEGTRGLRLAVELENVEGVVHERPRARLQRPEPRPPVLVERADLAVEDDVRRACGVPDRARHSGESAREVV